VVCTLQALRLLSASLTSKSTLTSGLEDFFNVPKQDSNLTSKYIQTSRLDEVAKKPKLEDWTIIQLQFQPLFWPIDIEDFGPWLAISVGSLWFTFTYYYFIVFFCVINLI
jgi:hypothetical protein